MRSRRVLIGAVFLVAGSTVVPAQDRLRSAAGYERAQRMARETPTAVRGGNLAVHWVSSTAFEYSREGKRFHYDVGTKMAWEIPLVERTASGGRGGESPDRGRQFEA